MNEYGMKGTWVENIILVDADYVDSVAFDLTVNFERMLERRIAQADLAHWIDCVALDGGLRPKEQETHVIMLHDRNKRKLENFTPGSFKDELDGQAFRDQLGEFSISCVPVEKLTTMEELFCQSLQFICEQSDVRRIMAVVNDQYAAHVGQLLTRTARRAEDQTPKDITLFTMQPQAGGRFQQEILGYSLMAALGIKGEEISNKQQIKQP